MYCTLNGYSQLSSSGAGINCILLFCILFTNSNNLQFHYGIACPRGEGFKVGSWLQAIEGELDVWGDFKVCFCWIFTIFLKHSLDCIFAKVFQPLCLHCGQYLLLKICAKRLPTEGVESDMVVCICGLYGLTSHCV